MGYKEKFWDILEDLFVGQKVEGKGGYINLLGVKSTYFKNFMAPTLRAFMVDSLKNMRDFEEELYYKLYTFFHRYFSETGTVYFNYTPLYYKIFEKVYNNDREGEAIVRVDYNTDYEQILSDKQDVALFWKTKMLYYVKSDKVIRNMFVEIEDWKFYFDVSDLEHKKNNEKREFVYQFERYDYVVEGSPQKAIILKVKYTENGKKTNIDELVKQIRRSDKILRKIEEAAVKKAIRTFERQVNVDFFINKDVSRFLKQQFDLWMYQYLYSQKVDFTQKRLNQLQALKEVAYKIIDFIAHFENELRHIWEKPRFVFNSQYVITIDKLLGASDKKTVLEDIITQLKSQYEQFKNNLSKLQQLKKEHKHLRERLETYCPQNQIEEWFLMDMIDDNFKVEDIVTNGLPGMIRLNEKYQFLPIDTKYFKGLKERIEEIFDVDEELDGWLIKSENWQALNTILPKFREKIQTIYIDPPFNKEQDADYDYIVKFKDSTWITMLENRISLAKELLNERGSIFVRCDYNGNMYVRLLLNEIFGEENFRNEIVVTRTKTALYLYAPPSKPFNLSQVYDTIYWFSKSMYIPFPNLSRGITPEHRYAYWKDFKTFYEKEENRYELLGIVPEHGTSWMWKKEEALKALKNYQIYEAEFKPKGMSLDEYWEQTGRKLNFLRREGNTIKYWVPPIKFISHNNWTDIEGYARSWNFPTENSEILLKRVIESTSEEGNLILDFFLGSGTTTAVAHKLKRKWIGIEMGEHFWSVVLPRMKKVLFYDKSGISKEKDVKEKYNPKNAGGFFKYYELEQYEDILETIEYSDTDIKEFAEKLKAVLKEEYDPAKVDPFLFDKKLTKAIKIEEGSVKIDLKKLYSDKEIDIKESISNVKGIPIRDIDIPNNGEELLRLLRPLLKV